MTGVVPVAVAGDEVLVPCVDGGQRQYLSFDAAAATGALPRNGLTEPEEALWSRSARQEAGGSPNVVGAVALHAAMDTLGGIGWPAITAHERRMATSMRCGLAAIPGVHVLGPDAGTEMLPVATFTVTGVPQALVAARLAAEHAIGVGHSRFGLDRYLIRLLGLTSEDVRRHRDQAQRGDRRAVPGAVRASAGIDVTDDDVQRLLAAIASVAVGDPPVPYYQDPSTGDFFPAVSMFP